MEGSFRSGDFSLKRHQTSQKHSPSMRSLLIISNRRMSRLPIRNQNIPEGIGCSRND